MSKRHRCVAVLLSMALHATLALLWVQLSSLDSPKPSRTLKPLASEATHVLTLIVPTPEQAARVLPMATIRPETLKLQQTQQRASMVAPPPPSPEEWAFAARYTNKNSKGYRFHWGQQVRSMMGTATEGPAQGVVRFRIEIAPDGRMLRLQTLWTTSAAAERLARQAIHNMPPLPRTPTGQPLVFDRTISFTPFAHEGPPLYKDDCLPDTPEFRNPFSWDGQSPQAPNAPTTPSAPLTPHALADCLRQLPKDSIEAETARDQRLMDQWGAKPTGR